MIRVWAWVTSDLSHPKSMTKALSDYPSKMFGKKITCIMYYIYYCMPRTMLVKGKHYWLDDGNRYNFRLYWVVFAKFSVIAILDYTV